MHKTRNETDLPHRLRVGRVAEICDDVLVTRHDMTHCTLAGSYTAELFTKIASKFAYNAFAIIPPRPDGAIWPEEEWEKRQRRVGLYSLGCKTSHSCKPKCSFFTGVGDRKELRALVDISEGDELTVDYMDEGDEGLDGKRLQFVFRPTAERRAELLRHWEFFCLCERCDAFQDDTRQFPCPHTPCLGFMYARNPRERHEPSPMEMLPCANCGSEPTQEMQDTLFRREKTLGKNLDELYRSAREECESQPQEDLILASRKLSISVFGARRHAYTVRAACLQHFVHRRLGDWEWAAKAQQVCLVALQGTLEGVPSGFQAHCWMLLGDACSRLSDARRQEALDAYQCAHDMWQIVNGKESMRAKRILRLMQDVKEGGAGTGAGSIEWCFPMLAKRT